MFRNYLKVALRNIWRNKVFSFINVFGLALGLACSLLIILWVSDELRYDQFHAGGPRLYQVMENQAWSGIEVNSTQATPGTLAPALKAEIPEVELSAKVTWEQEDLLTVGDKANKEKGPLRQSRLFQNVLFPTGAGQPRHGHCLAHGHRDLAEPGPQVLRHRGGRHGQNHPGQQQGQLPGDGHHARRARKLVAEV
jgi:hypothetical protein